MLQRQQFRRRPEDRRHVHDHDSSNESGGLWSCGFSPDNADVNFQSIGFIYEPLLFINSLQQHRATDALAGFRLPLLRWQQGR